MIYSVTGTLVHTEPGAAVVDVGGVAFRCMTSMSTLRALPRLSEKVTLYTYLNVREDALDLFGFATKGELSCFRLLTAISGVGPKVGLAILSQLTPEEVALAAAAGDAKRFTKANGVGQKLAQRIVLERQGEELVRRGSLGEWDRAGRTFRLRERRPGGERSGDLGVFCLGGRRRCGPAGFFPVSGGADPAGPEKLWQRPLT